MRQFHRVVCLAAVAAAISGGLLRAQTGADGVARRASVATPKPGDLIRLHFLREKYLSDTVAVNERGEAILPKLGVTEVSGMSIASLGDTLRARYAQFLREPDLEVVVLRRIVVNGEVKNPSVYFVDVNASLRDAVALAGGVLETADRTDVSIVRDGRRTRVRAWQRSTGVESDLLSGDQILVGRRHWVSINFISLVSAAAVAAGVAISVFR